VDREDLAGRLLERRDAGGAVPDRRQLFLPVAEAAIGRSRGRPRGV